MNAPAQTVFTHTLGKPRRRMDRHAPWKGRNRSAPRMAPAFCTPPAKRLFENMKGGARVLDQDLMKKGSRHIIQAKYIPLHHVLDQDLMKKGSRHLFFFQPSILHLFSTKT